jgi:hypothetical protein
MYGRGDIVKGWSRMERYGTNGMTIDDNFLL